MELTDNFTLSVQNKKDEEPVIYRGTASNQLVISLVNNTGADITFIENESVFSIYFPEGITQDELDVMTVQHRQGWDLEITDGLDMVYTGSYDPVWGNGQRLTFTVENISTAAQPVIGNLQVNFNISSYETPYQVFTLLTITNPHKEGNADLNDVIQVSFDNQGLIFVSPDKDLLKNSLFLNIKNTGDTPLFMGNEENRGNPTVEISFVYGNGTGCLAPDNRIINGTSPWKIKGGIPYKQEENDWLVHNPSKSTSQVHPKWILEPSPENTGIIGTNENANCTFCFSNIASYTPPGHTQAVVHFSGFKKDDKTAYDDAIFVLDIVKKNPPYTRGIVNCFSPNATKDIFIPDTPIKFKFQWLMYYVTKIEININALEYKTFTKIYDENTPIIYDQLDIELNGITQSTSFIVTINAYNNTGALLNSMQFTIYARANFFTDPRDGQSYPTIKIGKCLWMTDNLDYQAPIGTRTPGGEKKYGKLYTWGTVQPNKYLNGWRLPTTEDWRKLFKTFPTTPYKSLVDGGESGLNALISGTYINEEFNPDYGCYWTDSGQQGIVFSSVSKTVSVIEPNSNNFYMSVRYVKDIK